MEGTWSLNNPHNLDHLSQDCCVKKNPIKSAYWGLSYSRLALNIHPLHLLVPHGGVQAMNIRFHQLQDLLLFGSLLDSMFVCLFFCYNHVPANINSLTSLSLHLAYLAKAILVPVLKYLKIIEKITQVG